MPECVHETMKPASESLIPRGGRNCVAAEGNCIRSDAGWRAAGGGGTVPKQDHVELDTACCVGEPALAWRSLSHSRREWRIPALPMMKPFSAGCVRSRNVPKVAWDKWRDPQGGLIPNGSQSVHSSSDTSNDGGAKGRRKVNAPSTRRRKQKRSQCPQGLDRTQRLPRERIGAVCEGHVGSPRERGSNRGMHSCQSTNESVFCLPATKVSLPTGEPDAGNPPVRFGGRGGAPLRPIPTPMMAGERFLASRWDAGVIANMIRWCRSPSLAQPPANFTALSY
jgi:hypothetical protein